ncbi:hypothetical protein BDZ89DRAFT_1128428 [Hymenopellis radicata]|nr:hypothetical protein BDZ89DRAFT_1128428 [Hymenopellis radicata]
MPAGSFVACTITLVFGLFGFRLVQYGFTPPSTPSLNGPSPGMVHCNVLPSHPGCFRTPVHLSSGFVHSSLLRYQVLVERTKLRPLPRAAITLSRAWLFFAMQAILGVFLACRVVNTASLRVSMFAWPLYLLYQSLVLGLLDIKQVSSARIHDGRYI